MMIAIERCHVILWCSVWPWRLHEKTSKNVPVFRKSPKIHMILVKSLMISKDFAEILLSVISLLLPFILYHLEDFGKIILYNFLWIIFLNIQMAFLFWGSSVMVFDPLVFFADDFVHDFWCSFREFRKNLYLQEWFTPSSHCLSEAERSVRFFLSTNFSRSWRILLEKHQSWQHCQYIDGRRFNVSPDT